MDLKVALGAHQPLHGTFTMMDEFSPPLSGKCMVWSILLSCPQKLLSFVNTPNSCKCWQKAPGQAISPAMRNFTCKTSSNITFPLLVLLKPADIFPSFYGHEIRMKTIFLLYLMCILPLLSSWPFSFCWPNSTILLIHTRVHKDGI